MHNGNVLGAFAMVLQFGINMLVPICLMSALGYYLDKRLGTSYIIIIFFFVGALAGARNVYKMAMAGIGKKKGGGDEDEKIEPAAKE